MASLVLSTLQQLENSGIQYCLLRDADQIQTPDAHTPDILAEVDLLVAGPQAQQLQQLLAQLGFVALPSWGYAPHRFFIGYDESNGRWLKLDCVTDIAYGHPYPTIYTDLAAGCLAQRQLHGNIYTPNAEYELITLLLHCVLDKERFASHRCDRLQTLQSMIDSAAGDKFSIMALLERYWQPGVRWADVAVLISSENWGELLAMRQRVIHHLAKNQQLQVRTRHLQQRLQRKINHWLNLRRPRSLSVAILAPDGAGKSTLVTGIQRAFYFPVYTTYMGLYQKQGVQGSISSVRGAGFLKRLIIQWRRYLSARYEQAKRKLVIFDRYPYDALLPTRKRVSRLQQGRRWVLAHACPAPDLVIFLDAPGEMLYARKKEHSAALLEEQRQFYLGLKFVLSQMIVVDATQDADRVRHDVIAKIWRAYVQRQAGLKPHIAVERSTIDLCIQK